MTSFSKSSFASFTFVARYGLPPRSGWFKSMSDRCFFRRSSFVMPRSLHRVSMLPVPMSVMMSGRRTAFPISAQLLSVSSLARIRPCKNCVPVARRHRLIFVTRRGLRDPIRQSVSIHATQNDYTFSNSSLFTGSANNRGGVQRKQLHPHQQSKPKRTFSFPAALVAAVSRKMRW